MALSATVVTSVTSLSIIRYENPCLRLKKNVWSKPVGLKPLCLQLKPFERRIITPDFRVKRASVTCAAALNATIAAEQTQTVTRPSSAITVSPIQGKEKSPEFDFGGIGLPPCDYSEGGDGGGGDDDGNWFFFFLAFLGFLEYQRSEGPYWYQRKR